MFRNGMNPIAITFERQNDEDNCIPACIAKVLIFLGITNWNQNQLKRERESRQVEWDFRHWHDFVEEIFVSENWLIRMEITIFWNCHGI